MGRLGVFDDARIGGQHLHQLAVNLGRATDHLALEQVVAFAGEVADQTTGLGDHQGACGNVPGVQAGLKKTVVKTRCDVTKIERRSAGTAQASAALHDFFKHLHVTFEVITFAKREACADECVGQPQAFAHAQAAIVHEGAFAA